MSWKPRLVAAEVGCPLPRCEEFRNIVPLICVVESHFALAHTIKLSIITCRTIDILGCQLQDLDLTCKAVSNICHFHPKNKVPIRSIAAKFVANNGVRKIFLWCCTPCGCKLHKNKA